MGMFDKVTPMRIYSLHLYPSGSASGKATIKNDMAEIDFRLSSRTVERIAELITNDSECIREFDSSLKRGVGINPDKWSLNG